MLETVSKRSLFLLALDAVVIFAALSAAYFIRTQVWDFSFLWHPLIPLQFSICLGMLYVFDLYYPYKLFKPYETLINVCLAFLISGLILAAVSYLNRSFLIPRPVFVLSLAFAAGLVWAGRVFYDGLFQSRLMEKRAAIVGTGELAVYVSRLIARTPHAGMQITGFISAGEMKEDASLEGRPVLGAVNRILSLISWHDLDLVILAMDEKDHSSEHDILYGLFRQKVKAVTAVQLIEELEEAIPYESLDKHYILNLLSETRGRSYLKLKRMMDIVFSILLFVVSLPVFIFAVIVLGLQSPSKVFFAQERVGKDGKLFRVIKLRSMVDAGGGKQKVSRIGKLLRCFRVDELPQLYNVLRGEMSLVGPRPEVPYFVEKCRQRIPFYDAVFSVRPGITGWAQIKFLHVTDIKDYPKKFQYNLYYLKNLSLKLDLMILLQTIRVVLLGRGK